MLGVKLSTKAAMAPRTSALNNPMIVPASALSYESRTLPTDGSTPA